MRGLQFKSWPLALKLGCDHALGLLKIRELMLARSSLLWTFQLHPPKPSFPSQRSHIV